ncbi:hypothetical protein, partial [Pseudomonas syringae group genomosp. 7]|uniref:hypothetical protein n=1 Tax=Pseudomonas syringae group genomosp. 7 TaxID=251699 RepID=UPI003770149A
MLKKIRGEHEEEKEPGTKRKNTTPTPTNKKANTQPKITAKTKTTKKPLYTTHTKYPKPQRKPQ